MTPAESQSILLAANLQPIGLAIETNNPKQLQITLENYRRTLADPQFSNLIFAIPSIDSHVFIYRRSTSLNPSGS